MPPRGCPRGQTALVKVLGYEWLLVFVIMREVAFCYYAYVNLFDFATIIYH
jgi:hypothetical protein